MPLPAFDAEGNLPEGVHDATWRDLAKRYGSTPHRRRLLGGLKRALLALKTAGCGTAYVDGSFITAKEVPGDFDACWEDAGVDVAKLDPVLLKFGNKRAAQKTKYLGEFLPAHAQADPIGRAFLDFFQTDRDTGRRKGIVRIDVRRLR